MSLLSFGVRGKLMLIIGAVMTLMVGSAAIGFWGAWQSIQLFDKTVMARDTEAVAVATLSTDFKSQIQEWKDVLLRGADPAALEKYWGNFQKQEALVAEEVQRLIGSVPDAQSAQLLRDFAAAHKDMGEAYRRGLAQFKNSGFDSRAGDKAVVGIDREPSKLLSQARDRILADARSRGEAAATRGYSNLRASVLIMAGVSFFGLVLFVASVQTVVVAPIGRLTATTTLLSGGRTDILVGDLERQDEIGPLARALEQWRVSLTESHALRLAQEQQKQLTADAQKAAVLATADSLETHVGNVISSVSAATEKLENSAEQLANNTVKSSVLATSVAAAADQATRNVATVAAATEELSASSGAIASQMAASLSVATRAAGEARTASTLISHLSESVTSIGAIVELINDIASQTNLLALNATIEAARAGEAGKGFAVVAGEVKTLASQTAKATSDISARIGLVEAGTQNAVAAIEAISQVIDEINAIGENVSVSVQQQTEATSEIARNIDQAAAGTLAVCRSIADVEALSRENSGAAAEMRVLAVDLTQQGRSLDASVTRFLAEVRGAPGY